jgi:CYTH domain-containing protein
MAYTRQFLVAPAFARLIRKERGTQGRVREGYFSSTPERTHFVRLDRAGCALMMQIQGPDGLPREEATEVPLSQAQALLDVAPGQIAYERTLLALAPGVEGVLEQMLVSRPFTLLAVTFDEAAEAKRFQPPLWAGAEVSGDPAFGKAALALQGDPEAGEPEISNAALEALLDLLQSRFASRRAGGYSAWSQAPDQTDRTSPVDDQLLAGLAHALGSSGQDTAASDQRDDTAGYHAPRRFGHIAG